MAFEHYIRSGGRNLRLGYTTGTCAALACAGAAEGLLTGRIPQVLNLITPKGIEVSARPVSCAVEYGSGCLYQTSTGEMRPPAVPCLARCGVVKDAGDDIDATDGLLIMAQAQYWNPESVLSGGTPREESIRILGGKGVGRVTRPGLDQKVGEAAINSVPRQMIRQEVLRVCSEQGYEGGMTITVSVPDGEAAAEKTLNASLGIVGGISIIGTSGIVEPMSMKAYSDSVRLRIRQARSEGKQDLILTPGNYGLSFLRQAGYDLMDVPVVVCSNFIGDALDEAAADGFGRILLAGHVGKLVKIAAGIMNTHSSMADGRCEIFTAHAALAGASAETCARLMDAVTSDGCIAILREAGIDRAVLGTILEKAQGYLDRRNAGTRCGMILFSNVYGELGRTGIAKEILEAWTAGSELICTAVWQDSQKSQENGKEFRSRV